MEKFNLDLLRSMVIFFSDVTPKKEIVHECIFWLGVLEFTPLLVSKTNFIQAMPQPLGVFLFFLAIIFDSHCLQRSTNPRVEKVIIVKQSAQRGVFSHSGESQKSPKEKLQPKTNNARKTQNVFPTFDRPEHFFD